MERNDKPYLAIMLSHAPIIRVRMILSLSSTKWDLYSIVLIHILYLWDENSSC